MNRCLSLGLVAFTVMPACAGTAHQSAPPSTASAPAAAAGPGSRRGALRMPSVLPALPNRPYLDLGPVITSTPVEGAHGTERLLVFADELHADGFVLETRGLGEAYGLDVSRQAKWRDAHPGLSVTADIARFLITGDLSEPTSDVKSSQRAYYRAIRRVEQIPAVVDLTATPLAADLRAELAVAKDFQGQLDVAHGLFAAGYLDVNRYLDVRRTLLRLLDEKAG